MSTETGPVQERHDSNDLSLEPRLETSRKQSNGNDVHGDENGPDGHQPEERDHRREQERSISSGEQKGLGITAGLITLFLFIRLLAVSGWEWTTAADIADSFNFDDAVPIMFGTLFELPEVTGVIISVLLPLAIFRVYLNWTKGNIIAKAKNLFIIGTLLVTLLVLIHSYQMWWPLVASAALMVILIVVNRVWASGRAHELLTDLGKHTGLLFLGSLLLLALVVDTPWMPREEITTEQGVIHGHVLEASPGFLKVLTDEKEVLILTDSEIVKRETVDR